MNQQADPLADLRGLHLPPDPGFWPLAPGWWLLMLALLAIVAIGIWLWRRHAQRSRPHPALAEAARLQVRAQSLDDQTLIAQCSALLRRVAVQQHGPQVAGLAGAAWVQHLQTHTPESVTDASELWQTLGASRYAPSPQVGSRERLIAACQAWVAHAVQAEQNHAHV